MSDKILTPLFRGSYVNAFKPRRVGNEGEPKYGVTIVLPKNDPKTKAFLTKLKAMFNAAMVEKLGKALPEASLKHYPIRDGDTYTDEDGEPRPEFAGSWVITAKNTKQPGLVVMEADGTKRPPEGEHEFYSGAWYYASVQVYAWKHDTGGKGVSVSLSGLLKAKDGEAIGGSRFSESEFDEAAPVAGDEDNL